MLILARRCGKNRGGGGPLRKVWGAGPEGPRGKGER